MKLILGASCLDVVALGFDEGVESVSWRLFVLALIVPIWFSLVCSQLEMKWTGCIGCPDCAECEDLVQMKRFGHCFLVFSVP